MATCGVLTLIPSHLSQSQRDSSTAPEDAEQDTPCMFTLDESALTWQPTEGAAAGKRNGRFMLLDTLAITRETPEIFILACDDGEEFTVQAPSEGECTMWFKAISRGICEAKGEEYEEMDDDDGDDEKEEEEEEEEEKNDEFDETFNMDCTLFQFTLLYFNYIHTHSLIR